MLEPRADAPGAKKVNPEDILPTALQFMVEMSCGKCVAAVESAVAAVPGVEAVTGALCSMLASLVLPCASCSPP